MKKLVHFLIVALVVLSGLECVAAPLPNKPNNQRLGPHPTRLIAKLKEGNANRVASLVSNHGLSIIKRFSHSPGLVVLDESAATAKAQANSTPQDRKSKLLGSLKALRESGLFEFVEPDYLLSANVVPSDSAYQNGTLWGL